MSLAKETATGSGVSASVNERTMSFARVMNRCTDEAEGDGDGTSVGVVSGPSTTAAVQLESLLTAAAGGLEVGCVDANTGWASASWPTAAQMADSWACVTDCCVSSAEKSMPSCESVLGLVDQCSGR